MIADTHDAKVLSSSLTASNQIAGAGGEFRQVRDTILTETITFANLTRLRMFIKSLNHSFALCGAGRESLKSELAAATTENTGSGQLYDSLRAEVADVREGLVATMPLFDS